MRSTLESFLLGVNSRLALAETVLCVLVLLGFIHEGLIWPLLSGAAIAPLLLLKREASVEVGVARFASLTRALRLNAAGNSPDGLLGWIWFFLRLLCLGVGSLAIKVVTAAQFAFSVRSFAAIPDNFRRQMLVIDLFSPSELVPGVEEAYGRYRDSVLTPTDLLRDFTDRESLVFVYLGEIKRNPLVSMAGMLALGPLFLLAWLYRFSLKASCLLYWPFLFVHRIEAERLKKIAGDAKASDVLKAAPVYAFMAAIGGFAFYALSVMSGKVALASWIETQTPESLTDLFALGARVAAPKLFFTALFAMAVFYFLTVGMRWAMAYACAASGSTERGDFRFYLRGFQIFAVFQNITICVATGYVFLWAWPLFVRKAPEMVEFLF